MQRGATVNCCTSTGPATPRSAASSNTDETKEEYNASEPLRDRERWIGQFIHLMGHTGGYDREEAIAAIDAEGTLPDMLTYNPSKPAKYPNGRVFTDDVIDYRLAFLTKGDCPPTGLSPHTDTLEVFPYLGPPPRFSPVSPAVGPGRRVEACRYSASNPRASATVFLAALSAAAQSGDCNTGHCRPIWATISWLRAVDHRPRRRGSGASAGAADGSNFHQENRLYWTPSVALIWSVKTVVA